jgi:toxin-antitoxin system PIN domain toxin
MLLPDVNVLVYAFRPDTVDHRQHRAFLEGILRGQEAVGIPGPVLSGFLRIVTHPRIFATPSLLDDAVSFAEAVADAPAVRALTPGRDQWRIFLSLCRATNATGNLIPDAYLAAIAIEQDAEFITTDRDFARFSGLRWRHPLGA